MKFEKTKLPHEICRDQRIENRQLTTIIKNTSKWMEVLHHDCNGLFGNVHWVTRMMQEDITSIEQLPEELFGELNLSTQNAIYTLKTVYNYFRIMEVIADQKQGAKDIIIMNEPMVRDAVTKSLSFSVRFSGLPINVTRKFANVLTFLLSRMLEATAQNGLNRGPLDITFKPDNENKLLCIAVTGKELFWHHDLWIQATASSKEKIASQPEGWNRQIFYELLHLVNGKILSGVTHQGNFLPSNRRPELASDIIQKEISKQNLEFMIPFNLKGSQR